MTDPDLPDTQRERIGVDEAELEAIGFDEPRVIGRGGFGVVYRCREHALDRLVAVKVLASTPDSDPDNLGRFLREQQAMGKISGHPHIAHILRIGTTAANHPFLVMPYHARGSLEDWIRREGPLTFADALSVAVKLAGALETVHRAGILHRDVKPANVLLTDYGEPQLTDFGIARIEGGFHTTAGVVTGSPAFTAPEVLRDKESSVASDIYGLGATLFCVVTGHAAFERRSGEGLVAQFLRIAAEPIPDLRPEGIPEDLCAVIESSMAPDPTVRPNSAAEFGDQIRRIQQDHGLRIDAMTLREVPRDNDEPETDDPTHLGRDTRLGVSARSRTATPPAAATKFRPAVPARPLIQRPRLLDALRSEHRPRLIVVHAPAGFGKSTLVTQWARQLADEAGVVVAWLNADRDDNNVSWFLAHVLEAIRRSRPGMVAALLRALEEQGGNAQRYVLTSLINNVHESDERMVLIIEDWHLVSAPDSIAALRFLLEHGCHHLQVAVTSRSRVGLPISTMRVRGELIEIDSAALRFSPGETRELLVDLGGLALVSDDIVDLHESTEGWAAGLHLAALSLRDRDDPASQIRQITGRHYAISEYLTEDVFERLGPDLREALLATSISTHTCAGLATALTGHRHAQALLEDIERRDLFLRREDDGHWFRYHHLFAEFLRQRLERDHPEWVTELHRGAAEWFGRHHMLSEAVDHALTANDPERAVALVETNAMSLVQHAQLTTLVGLADKLPVSAAAAHGELQIALAWANVILRRPAHWQTALRLATANESSPSPEQEVSSFAREASMVRAIANVMSDQPENLDLAVESCLSDADKLSPWLLGAAAIVGSWSALYRCEYTSVRAWHDWAEPYFQQVPGALSPMYSRCLLGLAAWDELDTAAAERNFETAAELASTTEGENSYTATLSGVFLGDFRYECGRVSEAEQFLDSGEKLGITIGVEILLAIYGTGARIKALRGDSDAAATRLARGARIADSLGLPRLAARVTNERVRLGLARMAPQVPNRAADTPPDGIAILTHELDEDSAVRSLLTEQPELAAARAAALVDSIDATRRPRAALRAQLLLATSLAVDGRVEEAKQHLVPALVVCAEAGLVRPILDEGPAVATVLRALRGDAEDGRWQPSWPPPPTAFLDQLLADTIAPNQPISS
ncbi:serine/threonine-protein kinase [Nocardia neocaledoniensis]|uniref:serine/threonine-protein kinase n=1 Tax=Nocardia neocaledoniensis TaxID=236511 RepID=UPI00245686AA|nr:serine/threonine-protein kinase [Nocardia neocaledoniensis]